MTNPQCRRKNLTEPVLPVIQIGMTLQLPSTFSSHLRFPGRRQYLEGSFANLYNKPGRSVFSISPIRLKQMSGQR